MNEEKLAAICRAYHENKKEIEEAILKQLREKRPQVLIRRDFGMTAQQVSSRAIRNNLSYYS